MKVFEDLIEELKEENLIEEAEPEPPDALRQTNAQLEQSAAASVDGGAARTVPAPAPARVVSPAAPENEDAAAAAAVAPPEIITTEFDRAGAQPPLPENDFYRRRAMEEVSALQMVERVFSGVEREQAKITPKPYNDLPVSKALHDFLQVSKNPNSPESAAAEFKLMQETESWYSALSHRDQNILPAHLRRYCETTRPVLSAQALVALARFYRNSPYSESVRSKFDLIVTRLFSKEIEGSEERQAAFDFDETVQHLSELYADWSSIPLYSTDDDTELSIIALKFEDFITEAVNAVEFEELVRTDFFNRLRAFKESTGENFYAPSVTATAIKCNIRVGNRYVELLSEEKKKNNAARLEDKYNFLLDHTISEATSKTLQLVHLLKEKSHEPPEEEPAPAPVSKEQEAAKAQAQEEKSVRESGVDGLLKSNPFRVSKWLLAMTVLTVLATSMLYYWVEYATPQASSKDVRVLEMEGYYFRDYLKVGKITNETLIGVVSDSWYQISEEKKEEVLKNLILIGKDKGYKTVQLLGSEGKTVGYIAAANQTASPTPPPSGDGDGRN